MPYLNKSHKLRIDEGGRPLSPGELVYKITTDILTYLGPKPDFARYAEVLGAIEAAKLEFYAREIRPYEEAKRVANGDVYPERNPT